MISSDGFVASPHLPGTNFWNHTPWITSGSDLNVITKWHTVSDVQLSCFLKGVLQLLMVDGYLPSASTVDLLLTHLASNGWLITDVTTPNSNYHRVYNKCLASKCWFITRQLHIPPNNPYHPHPQITKAKIQLQLAYHNATETPAVHWSYFN